MEQTQNPIMEVQKSLEEMQKGFTETISQVEKSLQSKIESKVESELSKIEAKTADILDNMKLTQKTDNFSNDYKNNLEVMKKSFLEANKKPDEKEVKGGRAIFKKSYNSDNNPTGGYLIANPSFGGYIQDYEIVDTGILAYCDNISADIVPFATDFTTYNFRNLRGKKVAPKREIPKAEIDSIGKISLTSDKYGIRDDIDASLLKEIQSNPNNSAGFDIFLRQQEGFMQNLAQDLSIEVQDKILEKVAINSAQNKQVEKYISYTETTGANKVTIEDLINTLSQLKTSRRDIFMAENTFNHLRTMKNDINDYVNNSFFDFNNGRLTINNIPYNLILAHPQSNFEASNLLDLGDYLGQGEYANAGGKIAFIVGDFRSSVKAGISGIQTYFTYHNMVGNYTVEWAHIAFTASAVLNTDLLKVCKIKA